MSCRVCTTHPRPAPFPQPRLFKRELGQSDKLGEDPRIASCIVALLGPSRIVACDGVDSERLTVSDAWGHWRGRVLEQEAQAARRKRLGY